MAFHLEDQDTVLKLVKHDKNIIPVFILNSDNIIRKDPFYYRCDGGLCFDYLKACEEKYRTNVTESIEEK